MHRNRWRLWQLPEPRSPARRRAESAGPGGPGLHPPEGPGRLRHGKNHGKTIGKWWFNEFLWWFNEIQWDLMGLHGYFSGIMRFFMVFFMGYDGI